MSGSGEGIEEAPANPSDVVDQQVVPSRRMWRWLPLVMVLAVAALFRLHPWDRPVSMSDSKALAISLDVKRSDGLSYRAFVERRFRKARCDGRDPGPIRFRVNRTGGTYEFIRIEANAWDSDQRCAHPFAVVAGIPLARAWDSADYPDYRAHLGQVFPADTGMDLRAEPTWLADFRNGAQP